MVRRALSSVDPMVQMLIAAIALASFVPVTGEARPVALNISNSAVFLLFFFNGLRISRREAVGGIGNWRFLLPLTLWCFGAMSLAGLGFWKLSDGTLPAIVALGFLYLGVLPSTVQSATAYTSLAGGNIASSVVAAALLNILGVFISAPLFAALAGGEAIQLGWEGLRKVALILLLPFVLGQVLQFLLREWVLRNKPIVTWLDRAAIAIAVYVAFSGAVEQGVWQKIGFGDWGVLLAVVAAFLLVAYGGAWLLGRIAKLNRSNQISFLFAGGQKSTAMGVPLASVMFAPEIAGMLILPLLVYHLAQLIVAAPMAKSLRMEQI